MLNNKTNWIKVIPLFCTAQPLLHIIWRHPRWRRFFPIARKEQIRTTFAEPKLIFAIITPQIDWQLPGFLSKNKKMKEMCVIPKSAVVFTSRPSSCGIIKMSWPRLWIMGAVKLVGQFYGSPTALTSQSIRPGIATVHMLFKLREGREEYFGNKRDPPTIAPEPRGGDQSVI